MYRRYNPYTDGKLYGLLAGQDSVLSGVGEITHTHGTNAGSG
jgi:hypothetical protein